MSILMVFLALSILPSAMDFDKDGTVDFSDFIVFSQYYGSTVGRNLDGVYILESSEIDGEPAGMRGVLCMTGSVVYMWFGRGDIAFEFRGAVSLSGGIWTMRDEIHGTDFVFTFDGRTMEADGATFRFARLNPGRIPSPEK